MTLTKLPDWWSTLRLQQVQNPTDLTLGRQVLRATPLKTIAMKLPHRIHLRRCPCRRVLRLDLSLYWVKRAQENLTAEQGVARGSPAAPYYQTQNQVLVRLAWMHDVDFRRFHRMIRGAAQVFRQFAYRSTDRSLRDSPGRCWVGSAGLGRIVARSIQIAR